MNRVGLSGYKRAIQSIEDCIFTGNKIKKDTGGVGGAVAISNTAGTASIARCTFTGNKCRDAGALSADVKATIITMHLCK